MRWTIVVFHECSTYFAHTWSWASRAPYFQPANSATILPISSDVANCLNSWSHLWMFIICRTLLVDDDPSFLWRGEALFWIVCFGTLSGGIFLLYSPRRTSSRRDCSEETTVGWIASWNTTNPSLWNVSRNDCSEILFWNRFAAAIDLTYRFDGGALWFWWWVMVNMNRNT